VPYWTLGPAKGLSVFLVYYAFFGYFVVMLAYKSVNFLTHERSPIPQRTVRCKHKEPTPPGSILMNFSVEDFQRVTPRKYEFYKNLLEVSNFHLAFS
jgi:hypothetical protein